MPLLNFRKWCVKKNREKREKMSATEADRGEDAGVGGEQEVNFVGV